MFTAFSTALSALNAHSSAVNVVGNNLANLNTTGYKASSVAFFDVVTESMGSGLGEGQTGFGVNRPTTIRQFTQGAIQTSGGAMDAAINGDGFLIIRDAGGRQLYTRGGNLVVDKSGTLVTPKGQKLQGWMADSTGTVDSGTAIGDMVIPVGTMQAPRATSNFNFDMNLNASAAAGSEFSTPIEVFDSLGAAHVVTATFTKGTAANEWAYSLSIPDTDVATAVTPLEGTLTFDTNGVLTSPSATDSNPEFTIPGLNSGAADLTVSWSLYDGNTPRITQAAQPSAVSANTQDGAGAAQLMRVGLADGGAIMAQFSDGREIMVGQLAMAAIRNPESLNAVGDNAFAVSATTAPPAIGVPGTGGRGTVIGGALESSTVDLAREFTNLIIFQRGYQANTKVVTTVDEISQETLNIKR